LSDCVSTLLLTALAAALALAATTLLVVVDHHQPGRARRPALRGGQVVKVQGPLEPAATVPDRLRAAFTTAAFAALLGLVLAVGLIVLSIALLVLVNQRLG
jgi:hypothetical protein